MMMKIAVLWMEVMIQVQEAKAVVPLCPHMPVLDAHTTSPVIGDSYNACLSHSLYESFKVGIIVPTSHLKKMRFLDVKCIF